MADDDHELLVQSATLYRPKHLLTKLYVAPFIFGYTVALSILSQSLSCFLNGDESTSEWMPIEVAVCVLIGIGFAHVLCLLFMHWSIEWRCIVAYRRVKNIETAMFVKITPMPNKGFKELCPLAVNAAFKQHYFVYQKV